VLAWVRPEGFRNLRPERVDLDAPIVVISGANAQGKSSLLEAAYLLATTRSFRTRDARDAIRFGAEHLRVEGGVGTDPKTLSLVGITVARGRGNRRLSVGEYDVKLVDYLALLPALVMAGESVRAAAGSPSERRRFMDRATAAAQPAHLRDLAEYRRALAHRNRLLKHGRGSDQELEPWDELLARAGEAVIARRVQQLDEWQRGLGSFPELFPECKAARIEYWRSGRQSEERLIDRLRSSRDADRRLAATSVGPHRDDMEFGVQGRSLWRFGSSGQVRSAIAALTLAQAHTVREAREGRKPLLVLDDIDTDLDASRFEALLNAAGEQGHVLAATSKTAFGPAGSAIQLRVHNGGFERLS
jgi:DNA replication and repair protein RecF